MSFSRANSTARIFPFDPPRAETMRDEHAVEVGEVGRIDQLLRIEILDLDVTPDRETAVIERFVQALVALSQVDVLAHHPDLDRLLGIAADVEEALPMAKVRATRPHVQDLGDLLVEVFLREGQRDLVDRLDVLGGDHRVFVDVAEERDLALDRFGEEAIGPTQDDVGGETDGLQLFHGVLDRLRLHFPRRRLIEHRRDVDEAAILATGGRAELSDRFEEGQRFDIADRAADLDENDVDVLARAANRFLDLIRHVRDDLDGAAQVVASPLLREDRIVDASRCHVVHAAEACGRESFVVAEVEIGFGSVLGDVDLAMLEGIHRPGIDVQVGIEFQEGDLQTPRLEERADRRRCQTLAQ